jgi:hypothetical protein
MGLGLRSRTCLDYKGYLQACQNYVSLTSGSIAHTLGSSIQESHPLIPFRISQRPKSHEDIHHYSARIEGFRLGRDR